MRSGGVARLDELHERDEMAHVEDGTAGGAPPDSSSSSMRYALWMLAGVEGSAVMNLEVAAGQLLAPAFGASIDTWMWVLVCTMIGLAIGYFMSALRPSAMFSTLRTSPDARRAASGCWAIIAGAVYVALIPTWIGPLTSACLSMSPNTALLVVALMTCVIPMSLFGLVPGTLVTAFQRRDGAQGAAAGKIFAVSTCGGMATAFIAGLAMIPAYGVSVVVRSLALLHAAVAGLVLVRGDKRMSIPVGATLSVISAVLMIGGSARTEHAIVSFEEGMLGQILVMDEVDSAEGVQRYLYVNRTAQSRLALERAFKLEDQFSYIQSMASVLVTAPRGSRALVLGLGGGSVVKMMDEIGFDTTVVEFDPRIVSVARSFFGVSPEVRIEVQDARAFLRRSNETFDVIVYDVYRGEFLPSHVLTIEAIREMSDRLAPGGMVVVNLIGSNVGAAGAVAQALSHTFRLAGWTTRSIGPRSEWNTLLVADRGDRSYSSHRNDSPFVRDVPPAATLLSSSAVEPPEINLVAATPVLSDDLPAVDLLHRVAAANTRAWYIDTVVKRHLARDIPLLR